MTNFYTVRGLTSYTEGRNAGEENISICMFQENRRNPTVRCFPEPELQTAISIKFPRTGINKCQMCLFICLGFDPFPIEGNFIIQRKEKREVYCSSKGGGRFSIPAATKQHRGVLNFAIEILLMLYSYLPTLKRSLKMVKVHFKDVGKYLHVFILESCLLFIQNGLTWYFQ